MDVASVTAATNQKKEERGKRKKQNYRKKTPAHITCIQLKKRGATITTCIVYIHRI